MNGKVYIVGAGPGDEGLISFRALELLNKCDVVLYDYLANPGFLEKINPKSEKIFVGKRAGKSYLSQDEINEILVREAKKSKSVMRLKGGDPFIFGRGSEEALYCREHGVDFELIPGVSSAQAACMAGIPLTHRSLSTSVTFVTGHEDPKKVESQVNWSALAGLNGTLVLYMSLKNLEHNIAQLIQSGMSEQKPAALIEWASYPSQRSFVSTLKELPSLVREHNIESPSLFIIGEVVHLAKDLQWFENRPLFGKRILVTRSRAQSSGFVLQLKDLGAHVMELPTIEIQPLEEYKLLDRAINSLDSYAWLIFSSVNGVKFFFDRISELGIDIRILGKIKIAAVGPATQKEIEAKHLKVNLVPAEYTTDALAESLIKLDVQGEKILFPRASEARQEILNELSQHGAKLDVIPVYRAIVPEASRLQLAAIAEATLPDLLTFASSSTVKNYVTLVESLDSEDSQKKLLEIPSLCIGPITEETAKNCNLHVVKTADEFTIPGMVTALREYFHGKK